MVANVYIFRYIGVIARMGRYARKKVHKIDKSIRKGTKTKRRTRDLDQIVADLYPVRAKQLLNPKVNVQLPGLGQNLCIHCR